MGRFRFSLLSLLGLVTYAAICFAWLQSPSKQMASVIVTLTVAALGLAVLASLFRRGHARAWWIGFAVSGWAYLLIAFGTLFHGNISQQLLTSDLIRYLNVKFAGKTISLSGPNGVSTTVIDISTGRPILPDRPVPGIIYANVPDSLPSLLPFQRAGHSVCALFLAFFGGLIARYFYATRERTT